MRFSKQNLLDAHANYIKKLQHENKDWVTCDYQLQSFIDYILADTRFTTASPLLAAAPCMLDMLKTIENDNNVVPEWLWKKIRDVISKAEGSGK